MAIVLENTESKSKQRLKRKVATCYTNPVLWPSLYERAQLYQPGMYQATMATVSCLALLGFISMA